MLSHTDHMLRACVLARRGEGAVEPNPMVGCVVLDAAGQCVGEGWHQRFGGPHAEVHALAEAGDRALGGTLYVTLEPCCHTGKTPPCTRAIVAAGIRRVVVATRDPYPQVDGGGLAELAAAGIECQVGVAEHEARRLLSPYWKLVTTGRPWVIAKWAMTLDGKLATRTGSSRWISAPESRAVVHALRGRVDAVMVGAGTVRADDPLLSARPAGVRVATRVVMGDIGPTTQLAATAGEVPLLVATSQLENRERYDSLLAQGGEVLWLPPERCHDHAAQLDFVLAELGRRRMTNILVEGGAQLLGTLFDLDAIDELHVFVAPKLVGGGDAPSPVAGTGIADMASAIATCDGTWEAMGSDIYFQGRVVRPDTANAPQSSTLAT